MARLIAGIALLIAGSPAFAADGPVQFAGEWKTTMGPVTLEQKDSEVTGKIVFYNLALKGKVEDEGLALSYDEGSIHVDANWEFEPSGHAFQGRFRASNGNRGVWNGWRADPTAAVGKPADFTGLWLTDLGLMELKAEGSKVQGRYCLLYTSDAADE